MTISELIKTLENFPRDYAFEVDDDFFTPKDIHDFKADAETRTVTLVRGH